MKKAAPWTAWAALFVLALALCVMGLKIFDGNYNYAVEAYIGLAALAVYIVFILLWKLPSARYPHCGKVRLDGGKYCSHCGKGMEKEQKRNNSAVLYVVKVLTPPKTDDTNMPLLYLAAAILAGAGLIILNKKAKRA